MDKVDVDTDLRNIVSEFDIFHFDRDEDEVLLPAGDGSWNSLPLRVIEDIEG